MQQFTVPQFIDVEDKIMGPITVRQFLIMLVGAIFIGACYKIFDFSAFLTASVLIFAISGIIAFLKINGMPFHFFILNFVQTTKKPRLRVWNNEMNVKIYADLDEEKIAPEIQILPEVKSYSVSRLAELSLIVDTKGVYRGEDEGEKIRIKSNIKELS